MAILDEQYESIRGSDLSLFSYPSTINTTAQGASTNPELTRFVDANSLRDSIIQTATNLSQKNLHPMLRGVEEQCLNERLQELKYDIESTPVIEVKFSHRLTAYSRAYDDLISVFQQDSYLNEVHQVQIPSKNIQAVTVLVGKAGEGFYQPRVVLQVLTGLEQPVLVIKDGKTAQEQGSARWFDFPLQLSRISTLGLPIK